MTEVERDVEALRQACRALPQSHTYSAALDRLVAALRHEHEAKLAAIERWRARATADPLRPAPPPASGSRAGKRPRSAGRSNRVA